jgi:predicted phage terminase large subunit-like protein
MTDEQKAEVLLGAPRNFHLLFMKHCWTNSDKLQRGRHTIAICETIDDAISSFRYGQSVFLIIKCPPRHGKSDLISRYLPPHFLGLFPDREVIACTYSDDKAGDISRDSRRIFDSEKYAELFDVKLSKESSSIKSWHTDRGGKTLWAGVGGGITGSGYHLGIIDDYLKNREQAESETIRRTQWEWLTNVFLTRRAPVSITIILATPWHTDDLIGRIEQRVKDDKDFPAFRSITFPAQSDSYEDQYLFRARFTVEWYESQKAALGEYGWQSLMQCDPSPRGGNLFRVENIKTGECPNIEYVRAWDLASSTAERMSEDPDYTVGALVGIVRKEQAGVRWLEVYLKDVIRFREEAPRRNQIICETAAKDGDAVKIAIERVGAYKDAYNEIQNLLIKSRIVWGITVSTDKVSRATKLETAIATGNFTVSPKCWNDDIKKEFASFPSGKHDDIIDAVNVGIIFFEQRGYVKL